MGVTNHLLTGMILQATWESWGFLVDFELMQIQIATYTFKVLYSMEKSFQGRRSISYVAAKKSTHSETFLNELTGSSLKVSSRRRNMIIIHHFFEWNIYWVLESRECQKVIIQGRIENSHVDPVVTKHPDMLKTFSIGLT